MLRQWDFISAMIANMLVRSRRVTWTHLNVKKVHSICFEQEEVKWEKVGFTIFQETWECLGLQWRCWRATRRIRWTWGWSRRKWLMTFRYVAWASGQIWGHHWDWKGWKRRDGFRGLDLSCVSLRCLFTLWIKVEEATGFIGLELLGVFLVQEYILESSA